MSISNELRASYELVMADLENERATLHAQIVPLQARMKELHHSIATLSGRLHPEETLPPAYPVSPARQPSQKYAHMSVRWAILDTLIDSGPLATPEIAEALKAAGITTRATNFANNVSAVLSSTMKERHKEVEQLPDGRWELNENGKRAIAYIRTTPKFRHASVAGNGQSLRGAQAMKIHK